MKRLLFLWVSFIVALTVPLIHTTSAAEPSGQVTILQEVLILNSYHPGYAFSDDEQAGVIDVFRAKDRNWLPVIEYLDMKRLPDGKHLIELKKLFSRKYQNKKFSVVIAMDNPALEFAIDNQAELFGNTPIVFCGINNYTPSLLKGHLNVTGIVEAIDIAGTIEVMLRLHPATQEIFSPHDYTATGLAVRKELEALVPRFGKVRFRFTDPLTMEELLKELERLPKDSLVLEIGFIADKSGCTFGISDTTKLFYECSPVPIYSTYEQRLGFGIVGGKLLSARIHGADAARIALRVLAGEKASAIPVVFESDSQFMFDYKVMSRFGIPLSALPEGSTVINKPVSFYAAHRVVIQTAVGVIAFLAVVISLLAINIIQRRRSAEVIRRSEELFKVITSSTPDHLLVQDSDLRYSFVMNPQMGLTEQDMIGKTDYDFLSKEDADKLTEIKREVLKTGSPAHVEVPLTSSNGEQQYFDGSYIPKFDAKGQVDGLIGYFRNVTERKRTEKALWESEQRFRNAFSNAPIGMALVDIHEKFLQVNQTLCHILGYTKEQLLDTTVPAITHPDDLQAEAKYKKQTESGEIQSFHFEKRYLHADGHIVWGMLSVSAVTDESGNLLYYIGQLEDITERKKAEAAKRQNREAAEQLAREISIIAEIGRVVGSTLDIDEVYEWFAIEAIKLIPFDRVSVNLLNPDGKSFTIAYVSGFDIPDRRPGTIVPIAGSVSEIFMQKQSGRIIHVESPADFIRQFPGVTFSLVIRGGIRSLIGIPLTYRNEVIGNLHFRSKTPNAYTDQALHLAERIAVQIAGAIGSAQLFSDRQRAEEALQEREAKYRSLFNNAEVGMFRTSLDGSEILDMNEKFLEIFGRTREEMRGNPSMIHWADPGEREEMVRRLKADLRVSDFECRMLNKRGEVRHCQTSLRVYPELEILEGSIIDITERKRAEEAEHRSREATEQLAGEIAIIAEIGRVVGSTLDIDEVYDRFAIEAKKLIIFDRLAVNLHSLHEENIKVAYVSGEDFLGRRKGDLFPMKGSICEVLTRTRAGLLNYPKNVEGMNSHFRDHHAPVHMGMGSLLRVPLIYRDEVIGSLHFGSRTPNTYTEKDLFVAERIGAQIAGAIGSAKLFSEHMQAGAEKQSLQERLQRAEKMEALGQLAGGVAHDLNNSHARAGTTKDENGVVAIKGESR